MKTHLKHALLALTILTTSGFAYASGCHCGSDCPCEDCPCND